MTLKKPFSHPQKTSSSKSLTDSREKNSAMQKKDEQGASVQNHDARTVAIEILLDVENGKHAQAQLDAALQRKHLSRQEQGLCTELTYGTLRYYFRLNAILDKVLPKRQKLPAKVQMLLRVAVYSLFFLERVPEHAAVHHAVQSAKERFGANIANVVNGALRAILRFEGSIHEKQFYVKPADFYSVPSWLYGYFVKSYGLTQTEILLEKFLQRPKIALRLNPHHEGYASLNDFFLKQEGSSKVGHSGYVFLGGAVSREALGTSLQEWHDEGAFSWQASGSQEVLHACLKAIPELKNDFFWDACAGQGGKTLALLEQNIAVHLASDVSFSRLKLLQKNCLRLGVKAPFVVRGQAQGPWLRMPQGFWDGNILLDVPCTGFGTLARRPEIRLHRSYEDMQGLVHLQQEILHSAFQRLKPHRHIIYMTCTYNPLENEKLIEQFLTNNPTAKELFSWQTPFEHEYLEGMFVSVLTKMNATESTLQS